jgi:hypothetical protein
VSIADCSNAESRHAEFIIHFVENIECHYAQYIMLSVLILKVIMLSDIMLCVNMLSVNMLNVNMLSVDMLNS